ncbi:MAG: hypothetical protein DMG69_03440 [Acidobacteria bacterium]|nr:MAG: hypothetical protein DMG69_03440 [Acidobacteriota bacterium]
MLVCRVIASRARGSGLEEAPQPAALISFSRLGLRDVSQEEISGAFVAFSIIMINSSPPEPAATAYPFDTASLISFSMVRCGWWRQATSGREQTEGFGERFSMRTLFAPIATHSRQFIRLPSSLVEFLLKSLGTDGLK